MNIKAHFSNLNLTTDQSNTLTQLETFLNGDKNVFLLKGYAGTGKTTLLKGIVAYLQAQNQFAKLMAPTGRAAKIIRDKTGVDATTIHKGIFDFKKLHRINKEDELHKKTFICYFDLHLNQHDSNQVFLIDEASMISNQYTEDEFFRFGSGFLLNDLLRYIDLKTTKNHKVIFIGDPAQLPPVNDPVSRALKVDFFKDLDLQVEEVEMKEIVRQKEGSGILKNASLFRGRINHPESNSESYIDFTQADVSTYQLSNFRKLYFEECALPIQEKVVITYSNNLAHDYNRVIRSELFPGKSTIQNSDILLAVKNNYQLEEEILNGELVDVISVSNSTEVQAAPVSIEGEKKIVKLKFREVQIKKWDSDVIQSVKIIDSLLNDKYPRLSSYEQKALYINFIMRHRDLKEGSEEFSLALLNDPYFNAVQVKYGYALTCHKAQGGEWKKAFVDFKGRIGLSQDHLRWSYTAITRAARELLVANHPNIRILDAIRLSDISKLGKLPGNAIKYGYVENTPYHDKNTPACQRAKYFAIEENLLETKYEIKQIINRSKYHDTYFIHFINDKEQEETLVFELNNNAAGIYSSYLSTSNTQGSNDVIAIMKKSIPSNYNDDLKSEATHLVILHSKILNALNDSELRICGIDESKLDNYYISYFFESQGIYRMIQVYFNKKGHFSHANVKSQLGEKDEILEAMINNLQE